jgi:hypothetical protein
MEDFKEAPKDNDNNSGGSSSGGSYTPNKVPKKWYKDPAQLAIIIGLIMLGLILGLII